MMCSLSRSIPLSVLLLIAVWVASARCGTIGGQSSHEDHQAMTVDDGNASFEHDDYCGDIRAQKILDIQQMTGIWYGNELLHHDAADAGANVTNACIVVEITQEATTVRPLFVPIGHSAPTPSVHKKQLGYHPVQPSPQHHQQIDVVGDIDRHSVDFLRLTWNDSRSQAKPTEYTLHFNRSTRGTWRTADPGSQVPGATGAGFYHSPTDYGPRPTTTFLVMKAVGDHVVLTMCASNPRQLMTITLSRPTSPLNAEELGSVRNLLRRRDLSIFSRQPLCPAKNAAASPAQARVAVTSALLAVLLLVVCGAFMRAI